MSENDGADAGGVGAAERADLDARRDQIRDQYLLPRDRRPASTARGVHHVALICSDVERTVQFYDGLLGFPLIEMFENRDYRGSTHFFFDLGHGNTIAFFDLPGSGTRPVCRGAGRPPPPGDLDRAVALAGGEGPLRCRRHRVRTRRWVVDVLPRSRWRATRADQRPAARDVRQTRRLTPTAAAVRAPRTARSRRTRRTRSPRRCGSFARAGASRAPARRRWPTRRRRPCRASIPATSRTAPPRVWPG